MIGGRVSESAKVVIFLVLSAIGFALLAWFLKRNGIDPRPLSILLLVLAMWPWGRKKTNG